MNIDISPILNFLACETPEQWLVEAQNPQRLQLLLSDHANCELKAAQSAQTLIFKYGALWQASKSGKGRSSAAVQSGPLSRDGARYELINKMSKLAREELRHFEQVMGIMHKRKIDYIQLSASRYAAGMREGMRTHEPEKLIDSLIIGAFIEARSCERFAKLAPLLDSELRDFYQSLLKSESRHFQDYLVLAEKISIDGIDDRITYYAQLEKKLILEPDSEFRFHSGPLFL